MLSGRVNQYRFSVIQVIVIKARNFNKKQLDSLFFCFLKKFHLPC